MNHLAIITAFTPDFITDFTLLYKSIRRFSSVKLIAIPLGFDAEPQLPQDILIFHIPSDEQKAIAEKFGNRWVQWYKPNLIQMAADHFNANVILWLDSDIVIVGDPHPMLEKIVDDFFVVRDYFAPETCLNDESLYAEFIPHREFTKEENELSLNSGVVGMMLPRDKFIVDMWKYKVEIISNRSDLREKVKLYDQGALLWAMRDLDILNKIIKKPQWNHNPKRNAYDAYKQYRWPYGPKSMGGDTIDQVAYDNQGVVIAHFAGLPKLSHLTKVDSQPAKQFRHNVHKNDEPAHIFGVGLERAGTHTLAEIFRNSCRHSCWVRHEYSHGMSKAALAKWLGESSDGFIEACCDIYNRLDVQFICEVNHRLSFFVPEIKEKVRNSKFVLLLRNPFDLIRSRLRNFSCWGNQLHKFPVHYQLSAYTLHRDFGDGSYEQNHYRICPNCDMSPIEMHVWEIVNTLRYVLRDLKRLPDSEYRIIWIEDLSKSIKLIRQLVPNHYFDWDKMKDISSIRYGPSKLPADRIAEWIEDEININFEFISKSFFSILREFDIEIKIHSYL